MKNMRVFILFLLFFLAEIPFVVAQTTDPAQEDEIVVSDTTIGEVFKHLASFSGERYIVDNSVKEEKVPTFRAASWDDVEKIILAKHNLEKQLMDPQTKLYFIKPPKEDARKKKHVKKEAEKRNDYLKTTTRDYETGPTKKMTRLRTVGEPFGRWENNSYGLRLQYISGQVKNVGSVDAEDIEVIGILPDGTSVRLTGPKTLTKYETGDYSASPSRRYLAKSGNLRIKATCSNCRK